MEENKEIRILFNEDSFTNLCKIGFIKHKSPTIGTCDIHFSKNDIISLCKGEIISKDVDSEIFKFMLGDIEIEMIREVIKRSPIYNELSNLI